MSDGRRGPRGLEPLPNIHSVIAEAQLTAGRSGDTWGSTGTPSNPGGGGMGSDKIVNKLSRIHSKLVEENTTKLI
jgi:hypothetical protein